MKALIYARYSTDKQRETSIEDQIRVCTARIDREGFQLVGHHADDGVSGSTLVASRAGGARLVTDALAGRFDVLVVEGLDRVSRDFVEQESLIRLLEHRGLRIIGVSDGYDSASKGRKLHRGMRGLINEVFLDDLREKTHRGIAGQVARGFHGGALSFGYRSVAVEGGKKLEIDEKQAKWVVQIFEWFGAGWSCQKICAELNRVKAPTTKPGGTWAVSSLYGSPAKGSGILNNELYIGRYTWNRSQWQTDPATRARIRVDRPRSEWLIDERPYLRILTDEQWALVRNRLDRPRIEGGNKGKGAKVRSLLSGIMRCGRCGGAVIATSAKHYGCNVRKDRGASVCKGVTVPRQQTEVRMLSLVREDLLSPKSLAELHQALAELMAGLSRRADVDSVQAKQRVKQLDIEIARLVEAITTVGISDAISTRLKAAEAEHKALQPLLAPRSPLPPIPDVLARYRRLLADLQGTLESKPEEARPMLQQYFGEVTLIPADDGVYADVETRHDRLLVAAIGGASLGLVAGTRFVSQRRVRIV